MILGRNRKVEIKIIEIDALCVCVFWGEGKKSRVMETQNTVNMFGLLIRFEWRCSGCKNPEVMKGSCGRYLVF